MADRAPQEQQDPDSDDDVDLQAFARDMEIDILPSWTVDTALFHDVAGKPRRPPLEVEAQIAHYLHKYKVQHKGVVPLHNVFSEISLQCCRLHCGFLISPSDVIYERNLLPLDMKERKIYVAKKILFGGSTLKFVNQKVCTEFFASVHCVANYFVRQTMKNAKNCMTDIPGDARTIQRKKLRALTCRRLNSLHKFIDERFEASPSNNALMVAPYFSKSALFVEALSDEPCLLPESGKLNKRAMDYLLNCLSEQGIQLSMDKGTDLPKCNTCCILKKNVSTVYNINGMHVSGEQLLESHYDNIRADRLKIDAWTSQSLSHPNEMVLIKFDGMSASKTSLPCLTRNEPSSLAGCNDIVHCQVYTAIVARYRDDVEYSTTYRGYAQVFLHPCSANAAIVYSSLLQVVLDLQVIPPVIIFNTDSASVNKCGGALNFARLLLDRCPRIRKIIFAYSEVGHTHNNVDADFGNIVKTLRGRRLPTIDDMTHFLSRRPGVLSVHTLFPVYEFLKGYKPKTVSNVFHCMYFEIYRAEDGVRLTVKNYIRSATPISMVTVTPLYPRLDGSTDSRLLAPTDVVLPAPVQTVFDVSKSEIRLRHYGAVIIQVLGADVFSSLSAYLQEAKVLIPVDFDQLCAQIHERCCPLALPGPTLQDPNNILLNEFTNLVTLEAQALQFFLNGELPADELALEQEMDDHQDEHEEVQFEEDGLDNNDPVNEECVEPLNPNNGVQQDFHRPSEVRLEDLPSSSRSLPTSSLGTQSSYGRSLRPRRIFDPSDNH